MANWSRQAAVDAVRSKSVVYGDYDLKSDSVVDLNAKYSVRADIFRFALELGHCAKQRALPIWADFVEKDRQ